MIRNFFVIIIWIQSMTHCSVDVYNVPQTNLEVLAMHLNFCLFLCSVPTYTVGSHGVKSVVVRETLDQVQGLNPCWQTRPEDDKEIQSQDDKRLNNHLYSFSGQKWQVNPDVIKEETCMKVSGQQCEVRRITPTLHVVNESFCLHKTMTSTMILFIIIPSAEYILFQYCSIVPSNFDFQFIFGWILGAFGNFGA